MIVARNDEIDIDKIQLYTENSIDKFSQNPHLQRDKFRGASTKILNEIFTAGL